MTLDDKTYNIWRVKGHQGPHPETYHREDFERLDDAVGTQTGWAGRQALQNELREIGLEVTTPGSKLNLIVRGLRDK